MHGLEPGEDRTDDLLAPERAGLGAVSSGRLREFSAGRYCAHRAVESFGVAAVPITQRADGRTRWPEPLTGSITHSEGLAFAALARNQHLRAIGIDVEHIGRFTPGLWRLVLVDSEMEHVEALPLSAQARVATVIFSAKEAFYKCQYEVTQRWMAFRDVAVDLHSVGLEQGYCAIRPASACSPFNCGVDPPLVSFAVSRDLVMTATVILADHR